MGAKLNWRKIVVWCLGVFLILDIFLALWVVKAEWFLTESWLKYLLTVLDSITSWTGKVFWSIIIIVVILIALYRGRPPQTPSFDRIIRYITDTIRVIFTKPSFMIPFAVILGILGLLLGLQLGESKPLLPPASEVLISTDGKEIYVANELRGEVYVFDRNFIQKPKEIINVGSPLEPGKPQRVAIAPGKEEIYVTDAKKDKVFVFDRKKGYTVKKDISVGKVPRWIAITPDERKAYVSNEQPIPQGTISVIDIDSHQVIKTITEVNCPEGLAVTPCGRWLYVATQCGAGQDPVFVIDTRTDKVLTSISGLAVGVMLAITPDGKKVYVARGNFQLRDPDTGELGSPLSVIKTATHQIMKTLVLHTSVTSVAITTDGKHVLVGNGRQISIIETKTDRVVNTIPLEASPAGIAIAKDEKGESAYVWLPEENRLFLLGLSGLLQP